MTKTKKIFIAIALLIVLILVIRFLFSSKSEVEKTENQNKKETVSLKCKLCHAELDSMIQNGSHNKIVCQDCHGVGEKHISNPLGNNMLKPGKRNECGQCHSLDGARKEKTTKHIDLNKHNIKSDCIKCHNPHSVGLKFGGSELKKGDTKVCLMCHQKQRIVLDKGKHKSVACLECHGSAEVHLKGPAKGTIFKPNERIHCGKCHANKLKSGSVKQIDLADHNPDGKCIDCHITHNPLEFK